MFVADVVEVLHQEVSAFLPGTGPKPRRPYKFLDYYTEQDAPFFFGREQEVESISSRILAHRSFILHGRSGVGKSSLLRAGIIPRLKTEGHGVLTIRSFIDPLAEMQISLKQNFNFCGEALKNVLDGSFISTYKYVIFCLDQFEEFSPACPARRGAASRTRWRTSAPMIIRRRIWFLFCAKTCWPR